MSLFKTATKRQAKLRLGLVGPAGSGKTMTALRVGSGLAGESGRMAVIDTEHGSAQLYASDSLRFDVCSLDSFEVERYVEAIADAEAAGYAVVVIDSLSHAWAGKGGILEFVDAQGKRNAGGNFSAWRDATPRHNRLVEAILACKCHVIVTLRSKTEYVVESVNGRTSVRKVGLQPVQRDGMEYEFTIVADVTADHELIVTKTRATFLKDAIIREAGEDLGRKLLDWLDNGEPATEPTPFKAAQKPASIDDTLARIFTASHKQIDSLMPRIEQRKAAGELTDAQYSQLVSAANMRREQLEGVKS